MAQKIRVNVTEPDWVQIYVVGRKDLLLQVVLWSSNVHHSRCTPHSLTPIMHAHFSMNTQAIHFYKILYMFWSICYMAASVQKVTCPITIITPTGITVYESIIRILLIRPWLCNLLKTVSHFIFRICVIEPRLVSQSPCSHGDLETTSPPACLSWALGLQPWTTTWGLMSSKFKAQWWESNVNYR